MKKQIIITIAVFTAVVILIVAGAFMWKFLVNRTILDGDGMERAPCDTITSCSYSCGGSMDGSYENLSISIKENGEAWLEYSYQPYNGADEEMISHQVPQEAIDEIRETCRERKVLSWGTLPYSDMQLLDAPVTSISFTYGDNEYYSVNSNYELPEKGQGFFTEIYTIMEKYK